MFGGGSSWGQQNNNQQQQQPQQGGLFGGGGGFGQQQQQQQQPQTGFGGGGFGQQAAPATGGLFGAAAPQTSTFGSGGGFGAAAQQPQTSFGGARPTFGATGQSTFGAAPATGGGLFGNTSSTFGATNNQPAASGGMFGKPAQTSTFGSGATSGLFGAKPASPFGAANNTTGTQAQNPNFSNQYYGDRPAPAPPTTGTVDPAYFPSWQQDPSTTTSSSNVPPHLFHSISAMEAYRGASPDELRAMDYQQNRKNATPQQQPAAGGFGAPATGGFGQAAPTNTFGQAPATSTFGAKPAGGMFGAAPATNTGFGQSSGGFGQSSNTTGGLFGQSQQQPATTGFGQSSTTGGGLFGQPAQAQPAASGGLFGNTSTGFGAQPAQPAATNTFGSFGAAKPATTGFGATAGGFGSGAATNTFGQQPAAAPAAPTFGGFGQNQNQSQTQQPAASGGLFGGGGFGQNNQQQQPAQPSGGLFGAQQPAQSATGGMFGSTAPKTGGLFGNTASTPAAGASTGFSFGQNNTQQPAQSGGLFGSTNNTSNNTTGGGLFGAQSGQQQNTQQPASGGLFGGGGGMFGAKPAAPPTGGGLFGSTTQNQQQPAQTGSLFGNTGQSGGLFSSTNNTLGQQNQQQNQAKPGGLFGGGGGLFGSQNQQQPQQTNTSGGGIFGGLGPSQPAQGSLFGSQSQQQPQQNGMGSSLFGGGGLGQSTNNQQQPSLNASIDQNPYGRNELFNYTGQKLEFGSQNKKPALPPLTASSYRITPSKNQINKLRGFATPQSPGRASTPLSSSSRAGLNSPASDRYKGLTDTALTPNAFIARPSIKRLNVTPKSDGVNGGDDHLESVLGKSALKSSTSKSNLNVSQNGLSSSTTMTFNPPSNGGNVNSQPRDDTPTRRATPLESSRPLAVAGSERQPSQGQYWCKPRMEKLRQMGEGYLSKISNFTIGRSGFGEVTFLEPVDVTGFDLNDLFGKVVVFTEMELAVYPDDWEDKPPQGQGLNRPARITLLNCYPRDKATKQFITDMNDPRHARFLKRVKNIPETEFVSYTDDGAWTFEVQHFSKYGLRDGSDEDDGEDVGVVKKMVPRGHAKAREAYNRPPSRTPSRTPQSDDDFLPPTKSLRDLENGEENDEDHDSVSEEGSQTASEQESDGESASSSGSSHSAPPGYDTEMEERRDQHIQQKLGHEGMAKLREMQSTSFGFESQTIRPTEMKRTLRDHLAGFGDAGEDSVALDKRAVKRPSFGIKTSPPVLRQARKYAKVALVDSVEKGQEGVKVDAGLALGRSFRCSWGPNGELVHFGKICSPSTIFTPSSGAEVVIENVALLSDTETEAGRAERLLRLHLDQSTVSTLDGIPQATLSTSIRFRDFASVFDIGDRSHEANIFRLGQALFDEIDLSLPPDSRDELVERILQLRRKLALSKWLENAVAPTVDSDLLKNGENRPAKLFTLLSGNKVARAVDMALEGNDMRLASLISQAGRTGDFRAEMLRQLDDWNKYNANPLISAEYRRIYALLAGIMDISPGKDSTSVIISKDLDWKRAFGLRLWYGCSFESTIREIFDEFTGALDTLHPPAEPLPPYLESDAEKSKNRWNIPTQPTDILYNLIRVYSDATVSLDQVLSARNCSPSPTDLRLPWHLYMVLSRVMQKRDYIDRDEDGYSAQADRLTQGYAAQLEQSGQWTLAAFVLLHLGTIEGREKAIRALLHRYPSPSENETRFLIDRLQIPHQWIHESRAASLASQGDAFGEYYSLLKAELWTRAHRILVDRLAPEAVLRDDLVLLRRLCEPLVGKPDGWEYGGQLFIDYIDTVTDIPALLKESVTTGAYSSRLTKLPNDLPRLLRLLPALFPNTENVQQVACLSDMLSALHHLAGQLSLANLITRPAVSDSMVDVDRLHLLQSSAFDRFSATLEGLTA